jgi:ATP-binding cassette subfamily F protein uup
VGPNGVGKTSLIEVLTGQKAPDEGTVILGTGIEMAVFDQRREALDPDATLWENLIGDREMRVSGRADQVMVRGTPKHVVGYLKEFLFDEAQARAPVRSLSGGEKARLLLARIMAKPSNVLVLDEPTNDLDIETLDLLQEILGDYDGTVLLVSHDRDFLDRVATTTVAMEGAGRVVVHAGGWSDYAPKRALIEASVAAGAVRAGKTGAKVKPASAGLSFTQKHRLEELPGEIERLQAEIAKLEGLLSDAELFTQDPVKFAKASDALIERHAKLGEAEDEWMMLEEKAGG